MLPWSFCSRLTISNKWLPSKEKRKGEFFLKRLFVWGKNYKLCYLTFENLITCLGKRKLSFKYRIWTAQNTAQTERRNGNCNWASILLGEYCLSDTVSSVMNTGIREINIFCYTNYFDLPAYLTKYPKAF